MLQAKPYIFSRTLDAGSLHDRVLVAMDQGEGVKTIPVFGLFAEGTNLVDSYSGTTGTVKGGKVSITSASGLVLLSEHR